MALYESASDTPTIGFEESDGDGGTMGSYMCKIESVGTGDVWTFGGPPLEKNTKSFFYTQTVLYSIRRRTSSLHRISIGINHITTKNSMCVTKKKQRRNLPSTRAFGPITSTTVPVAASSGPTPATRSAETVQSKEKSKLKKVTNRDKSKKVVISDVEKKSEDQQEKVSKLKIMADQATTVGPGPPVKPPITRDAKRDVNGEEKDSKDPEYVTLNDTFPTFESAKLKGYRSDSKEKTIRIEPTQQTSGEEKKKSSGEKSGGGGAGGGGEKEKPKE